MLTLSVHKCHQIVHRSVWLEASQLAPGWHSLPSASRTGHDSLRLLHSEQTGKAKGVSAT